MTIEVCIGMIASGKTTYARRRADEGAIVVAHDDITQALHCRYRYEQGLREMYRRIEEDIVRRTIAAGRDAVIDRTHLTRESRQRWLDFARWPHFDEWAQPRIIAVVFPAADAAEHARRRSESDPRGRSYAEWYGVALHHEKQAREEPVGEHEGFHEVRHETWRPTS